MCVNICQHRSSSMMEKLIWFSVFVKPILFSILHIAIFFWLFVLYLLFNNPSASFTILSGLVVWNMWVTGYIDTSSILWKVAKITFSFLPSKYWVSHLFVKLGGQATVPVKKYELGQQVDGIFGCSFFFLFNCASYNWIILGLILFCVFACCY